MAASAKLNYSLMTFSRATAGRFALRLSDRLPALAEGEKGYPDGTRGIQHACARQFVAMSLS